MAIPCYVYLLLNTITGKCYVGSSGNPKNRYATHISNLKRNKHSVDDMQSDFNKYGDCFQMILLDTINDVNERPKEYAWMQKLNTTDRRYGYNYKDQTLVSGRPSKRAKHFYEYQGQKYTVGQLSLLTNVPYACLQRRLSAGWSVEKALNTTFDARYVKTKKKIC